MFNIRFKKSDLMKKISVNKSFLNTMMKEIDEQKEYIAIIEYIVKTSNQKRI